MTTLQANYFDGRSTRIHPVSLSAEGADLVLSGQGIELRVPITSVRIDERLGGAPRKLRFQDGSFCEVREVAALDALLSAAGHRDGWVDRAQHGLRHILFSSIAFIALSFLAYRFGLPAAAAWLAVRLPPSVGETLTVQALRALDGNLLLDSNLDKARQESLTKEFRALELPNGGTPHSKLLFRRSPGLGPNAFTLPDGTIVVLDELITTLGNDDQIIAVLSHELGHAYGHHGLRLLLESSAIGAFWTFYAGDMSQLIAAAPAAVMQAKYSQELEQQADDYGAALMLANHRSPALLADALEKLLRAKPHAHEGYLASHPPSDERMRRLRTRAKVQPAP